MCGRLDSQCGLSRGVQQAEQSDRRYTLLFCHRFNGLHLYGHQADHADHLPLGRYKLLRPGKGLCPESCIVNCIHRPPFDIQRACICECIVDIFIAHRSAQFTLNTELLVINESIVARYLCNMSIREIALVVTSRTCSEKP